MGHLLLGMLWALWCIAHSLLISVRLTAFLKTRFTDGYRFFRLFFNLFALLSLFPVLAYGHSLRGDLLWHWGGPWRLVQVPMLGAAIWLFAAGAREYDMPQVLGIRQIREHESARGLTESGGIGMAGILGRVRHPWYSGALLILWFRGLDGAGLVTNAVLTAYLLAGTLLEERKLVMEYGEAYERYQREVPMLIPRIGPLRR